MMISPAELVAAGPDVIFCGGYAAIRAAQHATAAIPLIAIDDDMLANRFVRLACPSGGNTTGVSIFASELDGKRQEILLELLPGPQRIARSPIRARPRRKDRKPVNAARAGA